MMGTKFFYGKIMTIVLLIAMIPVMTSCSGNSKEVVIGQPVADNTLRLMLPGEPNIMDPGMSSEIYAAPYVYHAFEPLVRLDQEGKIIPSAASEWKVASDGLSITFTLQANGKWSDGQPVTAQQFKDAWVRILAPETKSSNASLINPYIAGAEAFTKRSGKLEDVGIQAPDDKTLIITLKEPTPFFLEIISYWAFSPIRNDIVVDSSTNWVKDPRTSISNGPYKLEAYDTKKKMRLVKNTFYWNTGAINIDSIDFLFKEGYTDPYAMYLQGEVDGIYQVKAQEAKAMTGVETDIHVTQAMSTAFIQLNHQVERLSDQGFRNVLGAAIDRKQLMEEVLLGAGTPSHYFIPSVISVEGTRMRDPEKLDQPFDAENVKALVEKLKKQRVDFKKPLKVIYMKDGPDAEIIKAVIGQWEERLGLTFEMAALDWPELNKSMIDGNYEIAMMGYTGDYPHPMNFLGLFTDTGILSTFSRWNDPEYTKLYYSVLDLKNPEERMERMRQLEDIIVKDNHIIPLYHRKAICLMSTRVEGWYRNALSEFVFTDARLTR